MPAVSQAQQKLMGMAYALKKGDMKPEDASQEVKDLADSMSLDQLKDYAGTKHEGLPVKKESEETPKKLKNIKTFEEFVNESINEGKKTYYEIAAELVEIAASYTDVDLSSEMSLAKRSGTEVLVVHTYLTLQETLEKEDVSANDLKEFEKECLSFLHKNGIKL